MKKIWIGLGLILLIVGIALNLRRTQISNHYNGLKPLEDFLKENGNWAVPKPPRSDWLPGTILKEENGTIEVYYGDKDLFPNTERKYSAAPLPAFDLDLHQRDTASGKFLAGEASLDSAEQGRFLFSATDVKTGRIDRSSIARLVAQLNPKAEITIGESDRIPKEIIKTIFKALNSDSSDLRLYVITESLIAGSIHITRTESTSTDADAKLDKSISAQYSGKATAGSKLDYTASNIVIGCHIERLDIPGKNMQDAGVPALERIDYEDQKQLGEMAKSKRGSASVQPAPSHLHVLSIGLDDYVVHGSIGGRISGAPDSARAVDNIFKTLCKYDERSSSKLIARGYSSEIGRKRVSADDLRKVITDWKTEEASRLKTRSKDGKPDIYIVYFCGHGVASSRTRQVVLLAEDYVAIPESIVDAPAAKILPIMDIDAILRDLDQPVLIFADCCRHEDKFFEDAQKDGAKNFWRTGPSIGERVAIEREVSSLPILNAFAVYAADANQYAQTLPYTKVGITKDLGPISIMLDLSISECGSGPEITIGQLTDYLLGDHAVEKQTVRAYLAMPIIWGYDKKALMQRYKAVLQVPIRIRSQ